MDKVFFTDPLPEPELVIDEDVDSSENTPEGDYVDLDVMSDFSPAETNGDQATEQKNSLPDIDDGREAIELTLF